MSPSSVFLHEIGQSDRMLYIDLLLLADESEEIVLEYIHKGDMYTALEKNGNTVGVVLIISESSEKVEIKNIAVSPTRQGKGFGKAIIEQEKTPIHQGLPPSLKCFTTARLPPHPYKSHQFRREIP